MSRCDLVPFAKSSRAQQGGEAIPLAIAGRTACAGTFVTRGHMVFWSAGDARIWLAKTIKTFIPLRNARQAAF